MRIDDTEELKDFLNLIKKYNYPLYLFIHPLAMNTLPKDLILSFERLKILWVF